MNAWVGLHCLERLHHADLDGRQNMMQVQVVPGKLLSSPV